MTYCDKCKNQYVSKIQGIIFQGCRSADDGDDDAKDFWSREDDLQGIDSDCPCYSERGE